MTTFIREMGKGFFYTTTEGSEKRVPNERKKKEEGYVRTYSPSNPTTHEIMK